MKEKPVKGVAKITKYINDNVISQVPKKKKVSQDTVRRKLKSYECGSGGLVCEERQNDKEALEIYPTSLDAMSDSCNIAGIENIAECCGMSIRWTKGKIKKDPDFPVYNLFGRSYTTQESSDAYMKNHWEKKGTWEPQSWQRKKIYTDPT